MLKENSKSSTGVTDIWHTIDWHMTYQLRQFGSATLLKVRLYCATPWLPTFFQSSAIPMWRGTWRQRTVAIVPWCPSARSFPAPSSLSSISAWSQSGRRRTSAWCPVCPTSWPTPPTPPQRSPTASIPSWRTSSPLLSSIATRTPSAATWSSLRCTDVILFGIVMVIMRC